MGPPALVMSAPAASSDPALERATGVLQQSRVRDEPGCTTLTTTQMPSRRCASSWVNSTRASNRPGGGREVRVARSELLQIIEVDL